MEAAHHPWPALGVLMLRDGLIEQEELQALLEAQSEARQHRITSWRLGELLVERGTVTEEQVARLVAEQYELPYVEVDAEEVDAALAARLPATLVDRFTALPIQVVDDGSAVVAVCDPATVLFSGEIRKALGMPIRFAVAAPAALRAAIVAVRSEGARGVTAWPSGSPSFGLVREEPAQAARPAATLTPAHTGAWPPLGALLVRDGLISEEELEAGLAQQRLSSWKRLGEILVERGTVTRADVARVLAEQYELPFVDVVEEDLDREVLEALPLELGERYGAVALKRQPDGTVLVAVADPATIRDPGDLATALDGSLVFAVADPDVVESALARRRRHPIVETDQGDRTDEGEPVPDEVATVTLTVVSGDDHAADEEPPALATVVPLNGLEPREDASAPTLDDLVERARALGAATVRLAPSADGVVAFAVIEGDVQELGVVPDELDPRTLVRSLVPPEAWVGLPTQQGELVSIQLDAELPELPNLGAGPDDALRAALAERTGLVVVAGLPRLDAAALGYALIGELATAGRSVTTIEDVVRSVLPGIDQIEAGAESGLTVAQGLARILRARPDAVFVSEVADERTAELVAEGARAALVIASVPAPSATGALRRLCTLGADPGALAETLHIAVSQSAVRRICVECRESYFASADELSLLGRPEDEAGGRLLGRARGCEACAWTGFAGRELVVELLLATNELRRWLANSAPAGDEPRALDGRTLYDQVVALCLDGATTVAEARRVLAGSTS